MSWDLANYNIVQIGQNTEKSSGDMRKLAVTRIPGKDGNLNLVWKTRKDYYYYYYKKEIL